MFQILYTEKNILNIMPCKITMVGWIEDLAVQMDEEGDICAYLATDKTGEKVKKGMAKCILKWSSLLTTGEFPDWASISLLASL
jgi:hypothetical protein